MLRPSRHLSDDALILVADDELPLGRLMRARRHLASCPTCRARLVRIERTLSELFGATQAGEHEDRELPPPGSARARLVSRMADYAARPRYPLALSAAPGWVTDRRWMYGWAVVVLALAIGFLLHDERSSLDTVSADAGGVFLLPRADLTPGASVPVNVGEICGPARYGRTQPIPASVHQAVFTRYGADFRRATEYELDYLITPELGGVADARNLWPQPFAQTPWNAYVKDELERFLHRLVCDGAIDLASAQREMASDWIAAYKRYFNTNGPLRDYDATPLTALDRELILSELEEVGFTPAASVRSDGPTLMAMLQRAREQSHAGPSHVTVRLAVFHPPH